MTHRHNYHDNVTTESHQHLFVILRQHCGSVRVQHVTVFMTQCFILLNFYRATLNKRGPPICLSVCPSVTDVSPAKTLSPICYIIRMHRMQEMQTVATDVPVAWCHWCVCLLVCQSVYLFVTRLRKRLNGSKSCLGWTWTLGSSRNIRWRSRFCHGFDVAFTKLLCQHVFVF